MGVASRTRTRMAIAALAVVAVLAALDVAWLAKQAQWNQAIAAAELPPDGTRDLPPQVRFAQAYQHASARADEAALKGYRSVQDTALAQPARYNSANVLMRQAIVIRTTLQPGQAIPLLELAKSTYREVLRHDPQDWDARYNLERAQRLLPDPEDADAPATMPRNAERAATTMRGYSAGLP